MPAVQTTLRKLYLSEATNTATIVWYSDESSIQMVTVQLKSGYAWNSSLHSQISWKTCFNFSTIFVLYFPFNVHCCQVSVPTTEYVSSIFQVTAYKLQLSLLVRKYKTGENVPLTFFLKYRQDTKHCHQNTGPRFTKLY